jgi:glutathione S-transferase
MFLHPNFKKHLDFLESQMASSPNGGEYLCGKEMTGADIMMSFPLEAMKSRAGLTKEKYPLLWAYVDRLESREASKKAVQDIVDREGIYQSTL